MAAAGDLHTITMELIGQLRERIGRQLTTEEASGSRPGSHSTGSRVDYFRHIRCTMGWDIFMVHGGVRCPSLFWSLIYRELSFSEVLVL